MATKKKVKKKKSRIPGLAINPAGLLKAVVKREKRMQDMLKKIK